MKKRCSIKHAHWLILALCIGCQQVNEEPEIVVTAPPAFSVDLFEQRDSVDGVAQLGLLVESLAGYSCAGVLIEASAGKSGDTVAVNISGVQVPDPCAGDSGRQAQVFVPLADLFQAVHPFRLRLLDVIDNHGHLTADAARAVLTVPDPKGAIFQNMVVERLGADSLVWGYVAYDDEVSRKRANDFLADLKAITAENGLGPGYYSYFTVSGTGVVVLHAAMQPPRNAYFFVRRISKPAVAVRQLLEVYRDVAGPALGIRCLSTFGAL